MKRFWAVLLLANAAFAAPQLPALQGKEKALVVLFLSARCPCSQSHEPLLKTLAKDFSDFRFVAVHSNADENTDSARAHFAATQLPFELIHDEQAQLANSLGALKTPHVFVLGPQGERLYQGGVSDSADAARASRFYLRDALTAIRAGKMPSVREGRTLGCMIRRKAS